MGVVRDWGGWGLATLSPMPAGRWRSIDCAFWISLCWRLRRLCRQGCRRSIAVVFLPWLGCSGLGWFGFGDFVAIASGPRAFHRLRFMDFALLATSSPLPAGMPALHSGGFSSLAGLFGIGVVGVLFTTEGTELHGNWGLLGLFEIGVVWVSPLVLVCLRRLVVFCLLGPR